jgi:hypothetical protein
VRERTPILDGDVCLAGGASLGSPASSSTNGPSPATITAWKSSPPAGKSTADVGQEVTSETESTAEVVPA